MAARPALIGAARACKLRIPRAGKLILDNDGTGPRHEKLRMSKIPSPCIDVCKFKRDGHCIGCSMTRPQKSAFKALDKDDQRVAFIELVMAQQTVLGRYAHWQKAFAKKCRKKKVALKFLGEGAAATRKEDEAA